MIALALAAVLVGGGAGAGALVLMQEEDRSPETAESLVATAHRHVRDTAAELEAVKRLADLKRTGQAAERRAADVVELTARAKRALGAKPALAESVERILIADAAALAGLAQAATLTPQRLGRWNAIVADVRRSAAELTVAHEGLRIPAPATRPQDPSLSLRTAATSADRFVRRARRRVADWRRRYRKAVRARRHDLAVLDAYGSAMRGYLVSYDGLRNEMSTWIGKVDNGGVSFDEAYDFLADASAERTRVRRAIDSLDAPAALAEHHNTLLAVVDAGVAAVDAAYEGTVDYEFDWEGEYDTYREAPGWRTFTQQSESVAQRYSTALAGWETAFAEERKTRRDRALPKAPKI